MAQATAPHTDARRRSLHLLLCRSLERSSTARYMVQYSYVQYRSTETAQWAHRAAPWRDAPRCAQHCGTVMCST
eukprot:1994031-Pyramimonas_sp.AAC.1